MLNVTIESLKKNFGIHENAIELYEKAMADIKDEFKRYDEIREFNQLKVLDAFQKERISEAHFTNTTGYGYGDIGRDALDKVYASIFNCESALVRPHFVNGTHAIGAAMFGNLRPGDTMLSICGSPYDTLHNIIGISKNKNIGSLMEYGVKYKQVELTNDGEIDLGKVVSELKKDNSIKFVHIQRSTGYGWRKAMLISDMQRIIKEIKNVRKNVICFVDNCYGDFLDTQEPTDIGADLAAGSLIKNIGGGIALLQADILQEKKNMLRRQPTGLPYPE